MRWLVLLLVSTGLAGCADDGTVFEAEKTIVTADAPDPEFRFLVYGRSDVEGEARDVKLRFDLNGSPKDIIHFPAAAGDDAKRGLRSYRVPSATLGLAVVIDGEVLQYAQMHTDDCETGAMDMIVIVRDARFNPDRGSVDVDFGCIR